MRSGCPRSQGGFYSAFQHWSNVSAQSSPQAINVTHVPVLHPENEIQNNMVASQSPGELGVAYGPARLQRSYAQSQQHSQGLHHQQASLASTVSTGCQPSILTNTTTNFCTSADFHSSAHVSVRHSSYFETPVNGYAVRQSVHNSRQQRECSQGSSRRRCLKRSYLNNNTGLQQRKHLNCAVSTGINSAALQGDGLKVAPTVPLKVKHSYETLQKTCPLLFDLLLENPSNSESFTTKSSSSEGANANMALNTVAYVSGGRLHKGQQVKGSLAALNCGQTRTQHRQPSRGTPSPPRQQQVSSETKPPTNDEIHAIISKKLACFHNYITQRNRCDGHSDKVLGRDSVPQSHLPATSASREDDAVIGESSAAFGQHNCIALEEDNSKGGKANAELMPQFNETGDCATSASETRSKGTLVTAVESSVHSLRNESVEKSALVVFDLSVRKHLDVCMSPNSNCKLVYSDVCDDTFIGNNDESFRSKWCDKYIENGMTTLNYSSTALKELIAILENVDGIAEMENVSKVILQQYWNGNIDNVNLFASTEYPQIMLKVAATCTKNEDGSPGVLTAVPGMTWEDMREKQPPLGLNRISSQRYKSLSSNGNRNLDVDQVPGVSWALNHMPERKKGARTLKPVGTVGLDVSEDPQTKSIPVSRNRTFGCSSLTINRNANERRSTEDRQHAREDGGAARSQTTLSTAVPGNKSPTRAPVEEARPLYEDISDEDTSQRATELPNQERWEYSAPASFQHPQYEDISEDESQTESMAVETTIPTPVAAPDDGQSPFENGGCEHVQGQARAKAQTRVVAQLWSGLSFVETDDGFESDHGRQTNPSGSWSPWSLLSDDDESDEAIDDDDDEHLIIPVSIVDLKYEPEDEDGDNPGTNAPSPKRCPSPKLARATAFPPVLVFDTQECFLQAVQCDSKVEVALGSSPLVHETDSEGDVPTPQRRCSADSSETEDSLDYSSASERNYMTVSREMLRNSSAPVPSETDGSTSSEECEGNEGTNMQNGRTRGVDELSTMQKPGQPIEAEAGCSQQRDDIIIVDSDTEDEIDQKCKKKAKRKRFGSSGSGDSGDAPWSQQKRHSPETVKESSDLSQRTEKRGQRLETKAASEHVQQKTNVQKISPEKSVIIVNSEDDDNQNYEKPSRMRARRSGSRADDAPMYVGPESVAGGGRGPAEEKLQETRPSSADSPLPRRRSHPHHARVRKAPEDAGSDPLSGGRLSEARGGSEHVPQKGNRRSTSNRRGVAPDSERVLKKGHFSKRPAGTKGIFSSGSEDGGVGRRAESVDRRCGTANAKPQTNQSSSEGSPEKRPQSKEADSRLPNKDGHVIPRFVAESSGRKVCLKLFKEPVIHKQGKDGTRSPEASTASGKKTESCDKTKAHLGRNKTVRFFTPDPANDGNQATKNNLQANARKPARVSRQLSSPVRDGPSTSFRSASSTSGQPSGARQSAASSRAKHPSEAFSRLPYNPRELSVPPNLQRSYSSPSKLNHPPSKGPASTAQLNAPDNAKEPVTRHRPIRGDRGNGEDNVRPRRRRHDGASAGRAPRKRPNSHKPATSLMKRAVNEAKEWTKARNRVSPKDRRDSVGEGYKWSEKPTVAKSTKVCRHRFQLGGEEG